METLIPIVRDVLVIGYMFVLRLGVPLLITLMLGSTARKWLEENDARESKAEHQREIVAPVTAK